MWRRASIGICVGLLCPWLFGQTAGQSREGRYRLLFENAQVRVHALELASGFKAPIYQYEHDLIWVAVSAARVTFVDNEGAASSVQFVPGDARLFHSFEEKTIRNTGATEFRGVLVEFKRRGMVRDRCDCLGRVEQAVCGCKGLNTEDTEGTETRGEKRKHGGGHGDLPALWAFDVGQAMLAGTTLAPGEAFAGASRRGESLLISVTAVHLLDEAGGVEVDLAPGQATWVDEGSHRFKNVGTETARFVTLEF